MLVKLNLFIGKSELVTIRDGEKYEKNMTHPEIPKLEERLRKSYGEAYLNKQSSKKSKRSRKSHVTERKEDDRSSSHRKRS